MPFEMKNFGFDICWHGNVFHAEVDSGL